MSKTYDPNVIPDLGIVLPPGPYIFRIESLDDSEPSSTNKYMIKGALRVHEPDDHVDAPFYENFVIGTDKDLEADDPNSWKGIAAQRYRDMLHKAGVALTGAVAKDNAVATGQLVGAVIKNEVQGPTNRDGSPNRFAGSVQARIASFFRVGEQAVGDNGAVAPVKPTAAPATAAAKPAVAAKAAVAAVPPIKCGVCDQMVPKAEFAKHVAGHDE